MNKRKLYSIKKLLQSKGYVLVTDDEAIIDIDFESLDGVLAIVALKKLRDELENLLSNWKQGAANNGD